MNATATSGDQEQLALLWFVAARAMAVADGTVPAVKEASAGLYAQAILGLSEEACRAAKSPEQIGKLTLVDCLAGVHGMPREQAEKIMTGVLMIAFADGCMEPLEVRWASMLASACEMTDEDFQRCCASARVIASMFNPSVPSIEDGGEAS
ncbi:MAG: hypothetical protein P8I74_08155 [Phycisphaerales bacterium]|jgi:hypothetical protein|nr:hypothetical protein [Phycisphaerales bacterium]